MQSLRNNWRWIVFPILAVAIATAIYLVSGLGADSGDGVLYPM